MENVPCSIHAACRQKWPMPPGTSERVLYHIKLGTLNARRIFREKCYHAQPHKYVQLSIVEDMYPNTRCCYDTNNPPTSSERRACETFRVLSSSQASPASQASQPRQPARQASQPGQPGIEASSLQASMSAILLYRGSNAFLKRGTGRHRAPR